MFEEGGDYIWRYTWLPIAWISWAFPVGRDSQFYHSASTTWPGSIYCLVIVGWGLIKPEISPGSTTMFNDNCSLTCKNTPWFPEATLQQSGCSSSGVQFGPYFLLLGAPPLCSLWHSLGHPSYQMIQWRGGRGPNPAVCSVGGGSVPEERKLEQGHFHHICRNGFFYTCWSCSLSPSLRKVTPVGCLCWVTSAWAAIGQLVLTSVKS